ncbi:EAL domain-containing protein, partial [Pseudoalteromonas sp. Angola-31]|nr:EAL domain-containing protein [Pseudoalteromonas sp. Angola-31]
MLQEISGASTVKQKDLSETDLVQAFKQQEFTLHYQPQIDLQSGKIFGVEALIRWDHPKLGRIYPATFIPIAEETGWILPIGEWVLHTACKQNKLWQEIGLPPIRVSVNLSPRQFLDYDIVHTVEKILFETGLDAE